MLVDIFKNIEHVKEGEFISDTEPTSEPKCGDTAHADLWMLMVDGLRFSAGTCGECLTDFDDWDGNSFSVSLAEMSDHRTYLFKQFMDSI